MKKMVFVVDDTDTNLAKAEECLESFYDVMTLPSGARLFAVLKRIIPHVILLDIEMPQMSGFEVLKILKENPLYEGIPVIFLTSIMDSEIESKGFQCGAVDFINKPFAANVLLHRLRLHVGIAELISEKTVQLQRSHKNLILILADMVDSRDHNTGGHTDRTAAYIRIIIEEMQRMGVYLEEVAHWDLDLMATSAILHDVGKIGVSDMILNKPARLTDEEFRIMKSHAIKGTRILQGIIERSGEDIFLTNALHFAANHHECWDGTGYPQGLKGTGIPLQGRIMAIADVYDALISERPYKPPFTHERAVEMIAEESGTRFDPALVKVFLTVAHKFKEIKSKFDTIGRAADSHEA